VPASDRRPADLRRAINAQIGLLTADYILNGKVGVVVYELKGDGSLDGLWTLADQNGVGTERLVPMR
jgi:hypothetical protein